MLHKLIDDLSVTPRQMRREHCLADLESGQGKDVPVTAQEILNLHEGGQHMSICLLAGHLPKSPCIPLLQCDALKSALYLWMHMRVGTCIFCHT